MSNGIAAPVMGGLAIGIGLIAMFLLLDVPSFGNPAKELTWISYEPKQCVDQLWESNLQRENPDFYTKPKVEQYRLLSQYFEKMDITIFDVKYSAVNSLSCKGCGCPSGSYAMDFQVYTNDAERLKEMFESRSITAP